MKSSTCSFLLLKKITAFCLLSAIIIFLSSCGNNDSIAIERITKQRDSLIQSASKKDSSISSFMATFTEIENNLINIKKKEEVLSVHARNNMEIKGNIKDEIEENIKAINNLMLKNSQSITSLNARLKESNLEIKELSEMVAALSIQSFYKNRDLFMLNKLLMAKNNLIMGLSDVTVALADQAIDDSVIINNQKIVLNTAYYTVGDFKQLKEKYIVDKEHKFLGLNKKEKLKTDFNKDCFTAIDIRKTTSIPVSGKKIKLLTVHPDTSYKLKTNDKKVITSIEISDPANFWKISKFLVVELD